MSKKTILLLAFAATALGASSCNKKEQTEITTGQEKHDPKNGKADNLAYECPMDCEEGKTYEMQGTCPVCKMVLIEVKAESHQGYDHSEEENDKVNHEAHSH